MHSLLDADNAGHYYSPAMKTRLARKAPRFSSVELQQRLERIYDHLYANSPLRTPSAIGVEVGKLLHLAMFIEERNPGLFADDTVSGNPAFSFSTSTRKKLFEGESKLCEEVAKKVRKSFADMNEVWKLYDPGSPIMLNDTDIAFSCAELTDVLISDRTRDVFGDALEIFRSRWAKREGGQFFTDQRVTSLAMVLLDFNPKKGDDLVDICAGTGGFLLAGLNHIKGILEKETGGLVEESELVKLASRTLKGQEVDEKVCEMANATLQARLGKLKTPLVFNGDSLKSAVFSSGNAGGIQYGTHLCAATNPPFGTKITIKDKNVLKDYALARVLNPGSTLEEEKISNRASDTLFIEQNLRLLKPGYGRLAIVVPYQILSGPQARYIRDWILRQADVMAVVDLPPDTFQPHTGTKASLLVLRRRQRPLEELSGFEDHSVFMSIPRWIGHDRRGNPVYRKLSDGSPSGEILSDFDEAEEAYSAFLAGGSPCDKHRHSFKVKLSDIISDPQFRLNASFYRPGESQPARNSLGESWHYVKLKDVVERIFYPTRFKRSYVDYYPGAVPFLGGSNISQLIITTDKWLRHDDPYLKELQVKPGWLLITRSGSTGIISTVPDAWDGAAMSEHIIRIVPSPKKLDPDYLHAFLRTRYAQEILSRGIFGSVIDEITPEYIGDINIPILKSVSVLKKISRGVKRAQEARNIAIDELTGAVDALDSEFSRGNSAQQSDAA